jgi:dTMP kinase
LSARFLVIEGLDGAGTTTQVRRLVDVLRQRGQDAAMAFEPSDGPIGRLVRSVLRREGDGPSTESLPWLFAADRRDHLAREIEPALARGRTIVCDRYIASSLAYQSLDASMDLVWTLNRSFRVPDLTVWVRAPVDTCLARIGRRGANPELFEQREVLEAVDKAYTIAMARLSRHGHRIVEVDGSAPEAEVTAAVLAAIDA